MKQLIAYCVLFLCQSSERLIVSGNDDCIGLSCYNGGTVSSDDDTCKCLCVEGFSGLLCEYSMQQSEWPSGPYWLLMPLDGCPETKKHGWKTGYIKFTTREPFEDEFDESATNISIVFKSNVLQINFCYKSLDQNNTVSWHNSNFAIFGEQYNCPIDFQEISLAFSLPPLLHVIRDGYIPDVRFEEVTESSKSEVQFTLCVHERSGNETFKMPPSMESPVLLMKHPRKTDCSQADGMVQTEEVFPLQVSYLSEKGTWLGSLIHCYYIPIGEESVTPDIEVINTECKGIFHRTVESEPGGCDWADSIVFFHDIRDCPVDSRVYIDLVQTSLVSGILFMLDLKYYILIYADIIDLLLDSAIDIYVSNLPWNETGVVPERCSYSHDFNNGNYSTYNYVFMFRCSRDIEGRFITVQIRRHTAVNALIENMYYEDLFSFHVYGLSCINQSEMITPCTTELGMETFAIQDFQVTASTSDDNHPPANARPGLSGWEASITDDQPFIQVDLLAIILVNGVVIYNWQDIVNEEIEGEFLWTFKSRGSKSFKLKYGTVVHNLLDYNNMEFYVDTTQALSRPQRYLFYNIFLARYLRVYPKSFSTEDPPGLKFEILGCRKYGVPSLSCNDRSKTELVNTTHLFVPSYGLTETTTACDITCMNDLSKCFGFYFYESGNNIRSCKMIYHHNVSRFDKVQGIIVDGAMPVCWDNAYDVNYPYFDILTPYIDGIPNVLHIPPPASAFISHTKEVISSPGYPFYYHTNIIFTWMVQAPEGWLQITFTDIYLKENEGQADERIYDYCDEGIYFSHYDHAYKDIPSLPYVDKIDNSYNGLKTHLGFMVTKILMIFRSCAATYQHQNARGFRAVVRSKDLPSCSSEYYTCELDNNGMEIISNTFSNMPLSSTVRTWEIRMSSRYMVIRTTFTKFDVSCFSGSKLEIDDNTYCNKNMSIFPRDHRTSSRLKIYFKVDTNCAQNQMTEGFNLTLQLVKANESVLSMTPYTPDLPYDPMYDMATEVCSTKYRKCYTIFESNNPTFTWDDAVLLCKRFDMILVSLTSKEEMHFVKTFAAYEIMTEPLSLYIGLHRFVDAEDVSYEQWIDGRPLSFTAWDNDQPENILRKTCTIMSCYTRYSMRTVCVWKTASCKIKVTDFAVCEHPYLNAANTYNEELNGTYDIKINEPKQNNDGFLEIMTSCTCDTSDLYFTWYYKIENQDFVLREKEQSGYYLNYDRCNSPCYTGDASTLVTGFYYERLQDGINVTIRVEVAHKHYPGLIKTVEFTNIYSIFDTRMKVKPGNQSSLFDCGNGEWISILARCNGYIECSNAHDEQGCNTTCGVNDFKCSDGRCIHISQLCDYIYDCSDSADEYCDYPVCYSETSFQCENGPCIPAYKRCNAHKDCLDGSDEKDCDSCNTTSAFQCRDKTCIPKHYVCDKDTDCLDGSDEEACTKVVFKTCDDVWAYGHTESGLYTIDGTEVRCMYNKGSSTMTILHPDWECNDKSLFVFEPGGFLDGVTMQPKVRVIDAGKSGYNCMQKVSKIYKPYEQAAREVDGVYNESADTVQLEVNYLFDEMYNQIEYMFHYDFSFEDMLLAFVNIDYSKFTYQFGNIVCVKELIRPRDTLSCDDDGQSAPVEKMCIYDLDEQGKLDACRSMEHLSNCGCIPLVNCKTHVCEAGYFKCPNSFCIPHKFVCDGIKQCQNNEDESRCRWCEVPKGELLLAGNNDDLGSKELHSVFRFASQFYSANNRVVLFETLTDTNSVDKKAFNAHVYQDVNSKTVVPCLMETEEDKHLCLANIFKIVNVTKPYKALIWLQSMSTFQRSQYPFPDLFSSFERLWKVTINQLEQYPLKIIQSDITEIRVRDFKMLRTIGAGALPEFCEGSMPAICIKGYRCSYSRICIPLSQICDEKLDCPHRDDEQMCDFQCPFNCTCEGYAVNCRKASYNVITNASYTTRKIDSSYSAYEYKILQFEKELPFLAKLNLSHCSIEKIGDWGKSVNIIELDISYNRISKIQKNAFVPLKRLEKLNLDRNFLLATLESNSFSGIKISELEIKHTRLTRLLPQTFAGLKLKTLDISYNKIRTVSGLAFDNLNVEHLFINEKFITTFDSNLFSGIGDLKLLKTAAYKFCCVKPVNFPEENCFPQKDEFSSCDDLMRNRTLQALLWTIGLLSLLGNILSMVYRIVYDRKRLKLGYGIFVTNLAVADFLMGVYLMIIAAADNIFRDRYIEIDEYWRNSVGCNMAGVLSTISSEMSVMLICCITIDRILVIKYPFGTVKFRPLSATVTVICCWALASFIAVLPLFGIEYFGTSFYGRSAVCLALPLTRERTPGWQYSIVVFIGLNFILFLLIAMGQLLIYVEVKKHAALKRRMNVARSNDLTVARNLILLVLTDFMCWFPIGCMGMMALQGNFVPADVYAWAAILILPINSALNPFLYTFSTVLRKKNFSPDVEEQARGDLNKDIALAVMEIMPYFSMKAFRRHTRMINLAIYLQDEGMAYTEKFCIVSHLVRCIDRLHSNELVLRRIAVDNIFVRLQLPSNKVARMQLEQPSVCRSKTERAENMYQFALLVKELFPEL